MGVIGLVIIGILACEYPRDEELLTKNFLYSDICDILYLKICLNLSLISHLNYHFSSHRLKMDAEIHLTKQKPIQNYHKYVRVPCEFSAHLLLPK